jgi:hypothetical protein
LFRAVCFIIGCQRHKKQLNKYFGVSVVILALFLLLAALVSPKAGFNNADNFPITKADSAAFLYINNSLIIHLISG